MVMCQDHIILIRGLLGTVACNPMGREGRGGGGGRSVGGGGGSDHYQ